MNDAEEDVRNYADRGRLKSGCWLLERCLSTFHCHLIIYLSTYLFIYLFIYLFNYLFIHLLD